jgi:hypothetical protein
MDAGRFARRYKDVDDDSQTGNHRREMGGLDVVDTASERKKPPGNDLRVLGDEKTLQFHSAHLDLS